MLGAALAAAGASIPAWLALRFLALGDRAARSIRTSYEADVERLGVALRGARSEGKPLLVLVVPENGAARLERGTAIASLLRLGPVEALADLASCRVTCATLAQLSEHAPVPPADGEPWAALVEPAGDVRIVCATLPPLPPPNMVDHRDLVARRSAILGAALSDAIAGDREVLERRARDARAALDVTEIAAIEASLATPAELDGALVERGAALLRLAAEDGHRARLLRVLADATERRLVHGSPAGARWATALPCGYAIDGEEPVVYPCGMAFVPEHSKRFLRFYVAS